MRFPRVLRWVLRKHCLTSCMILSQLLRVYGRDMLLIDADEFTRYWYRQQNGEELSSRIEVGSSGCGAHMCISRGVIWHPVTTQLAFRPKQSASSMSHARWTLTANQ